MRLRSFEPFWLIKNGLLNSYPSLQNDITAEIAVIGGGITGALISHSLIEAGYSVVLLDKRDIAQGSTSATTAMLQYEIDVPLYKLNKLIGKEKGAACYLAGIAAINDIDKLIEQQNIDCGFKRKRSLYIADSSRNAKWLKEEFNERKKIGINVSWLTKEEILSQYGLHCYGGILSQDAASIDAYKFAHELIKKSVAKGLKVYDQTSIEKYELKSDSAKLYTDEKVVISCDKVIFCNGFEAVEMLKQKTADIFTTFACVSEQNVQLNGSLVDTLVWDTGTPYFYMRTTDDGRLLLGGEDTKGNKTIDLSRKDKKATKLIERFNKLLPGANFVEDFMWAGKFGSTKDGLPYIGATKEYPNSYFVLGFGGNGITFSVQGMELILKLLKGEHDIRLECYQFER